MKRKLITLTSKATLSSVTTTIQSNLTYDPNYRVTAVDQYYNGSSTVSHVAAYTYSEAGQLVQKGLGPGSSVAPIQTLNTTYSGTHTVVASQQINLNAATGGGTGFNVPNGSTFYGIISPGNLQTVDYRYNIRGQVLSINNSKLAADGGVSCDDPNALFGMSLNYNINDPSLTPLAYWDGKLSAAKWMAKNTSNVDGNERAFVYSYDALNRYTGETYSERATAGTGAFTQTDGWDEKITQYDDNGNIIKLQRNSSTQGMGTATQIDNLTYTYASATIPDQLQSVTDATGNPAGFIGGGGSGTYGYDASGSGNLKSDPYQGLTQINYNVLNKTNQTVLVSGSTYINYAYDAGGNLIRKMAYNSGTLTQTDYIDGFVYTGNGTTQTLEYTPMPEGRLMGTSLTQQFVITDPQGNARVAFQNNGSGLPTVVQENSYYGYGLVMPGSLVGFSTPPNKNMYNGGSEWQNDTQAANAGVPDYYQTFSRNYDPALGRFVAVDPMAEGSASMGVYHYAGDNPIMSNDPMGDLARVKLSQPTIYTGNSGDPGLTDLSGGGGDSDPGNSIGRSSDANWMNDGAFDDEGVGINPATGHSWGGLSFSSDGGAAGRAFWLPSEIAGGALSSISPALANKLIASLPSLGAGAVGSYSQNLVTQLRPVQLIYGQTSYTKNGEVFIVGTWSIGDYIDDANQGRPSFSDLLKNYPTGDVPSTYALVGGGLLRSYNQDPVSYANTCAMRLSYALNKSGAPIPYERGKTFKGADNLNYFIRVKDMASYMDATYGQPNINGMSPSDFSGYTGIIQFNVSGWSDATGHFTLWNGSSPVYGNYFNVSQEEPGVNLTGVHLWIFK